MSDVVPFDFENRAIRVLEDSGEFFFVARDVLQVLGFSKPRDAYATLDEDERVSRKVDTLGGKQNMACLNESGLYHLIFKSRKPAAKRFRRWVTEEVLPSIRKTGKYAVPEVSTTPEIESVERMTIPEFLVRKSSINFEEQLRFGAIARRLNQAYGVAYEMVSVPDFGRVRSYANSVLEIAWVQFTRTRHDELNLALFGREGNF